MSETRWKFNQLWRIDGLLTTRTGLHVGSGDITTHPELKSDDGAIDVNAVAINSNGKPYIPGSTIKGNLRSWLVSHLGKPEDSGLDLLFGCEPEDSTDSDDDGSNGNGGYVIFYDSQIEYPCDDIESPLPYWRMDRQTYIETNVAIDRITNTAIDQKLIHAEVVPPGVTFRITVLGPMGDEKNVGILLAALEGFNMRYQPVRLGAWNASGYGRMRWELLAVKTFDNSDALSWMKMKNPPMVKDAMREVSPDDVKRFAMMGNAVLKEPGHPGAVLDVCIKFSGPFLVDDPPTRSEKERKKKKTELGERVEDIPDHRPLRDIIGHPSLPAKSVRGALRSQAERIVRTLGRHCCDPTDPCEPIFNINKFDELCPICQLFGAPGWKTPLEITEFRFVVGTSASVHQDFVAIDRFTGGAKSQAKFDADYVYAPSFAGTIRIDNKRFPSKEAATRARGLLAMVLRDLKEGDIKLGFGMAKGYGCCLAKLTDDQFNDIESNINEFLKNTGDSNPVGSPKIHPFSTCTQDHKPEISDPSTTTHGVFHNPYHFIPAVKPDTSNWLPRNTFQVKKGEVRQPGQHTHDRYLDQVGEKKIYNGRILCRLETRTPIFIGGERIKETEPQEIIPFLLNGEAAIPATSLRGMLSSLVEAASCSSLRVLEDHTLSYRKTVNDALSSFGEVRIKSDGRVFIRPLTLPLIRVDAKDDFCTPMSFKTAFPSNEPPRIKIPIGNYRQGDTAIILDGKKISIGELAKYSSKFFYLKTKALTWKIVNDPKNKRNYKIKYLNKTKEKILIYYYPSTLEFFSKIENQKDISFIRGRFRIMGGPRRGLPNTVKHEYFIPYPDKDDWEKFEIEVMPQAIQCFEELSDQCTDAQKNDKRPAKEKMHPYSPLGTKRNNSGKNQRKLRLKQGDIVYIRPTEDGKKISEISYSSIWRSRVENDSGRRIGVHGFFEKKIDKEVLPFNNSREKISPAELLFGFAEEKKQSTHDISALNNTREQNLAFAGKIFVSYGRLSKSDFGCDIFDKPITLKVLANPKPPSPALYFKGDNKYISKKELSTKNSTPQGRKQYLHCYRRKIAGGDEGDEIVNLNENGYVANGNEKDYLPWESVSNNLSSVNEDDRSNLKGRIIPIRKGTSFYFHLDFDNLSREELDLICYALYPDKKFEHKIGMGKPIGLGSVKIQPIGLYCIHRVNRYNGDKTGRYNGGVWYNEPETFKYLPELYDFERKWTKNSDTEPVEKLNPIEFSKRFAAKMNPQLKEIIRMLGDPDNITAPVHYPQVKDENIENENYKWFVANDNKIGPKNNKIGPQKDFLNPLNGNEKCLPTLKRHEWR